MYFRPRPLRPSLVKLAKFFLNADHNSGDFLSATISTCIGYPAMKGFDSRNIHFVSPFWIEYLVIVHGLPFSARPCTRSRLIFTPSASISPILLASSHTPRHWKDCIRWIEPNRRMKFRTSSFCVVRCFFMGSAVAVISSPLVVSFPSSKVLMLPAIPLPLENLHMPLRELRIPRRTHPYLRDIGFHAK